MAQSENPEVTPEQFQQAVAQAVSSYFTPDINQRIAEMTDDQMWAALRELETLHNWYAILRYVNKRLLVAQTVVNSADPNTQPTLLARTQGVMTGLTDLQNAVIQIVGAEKEALKETAEIQSL